jgi:hypothetical protein
LRVAVVVFALSFVAAPARAQQAAAFAPGVISTGNVFRGTFDHDGRTFYFFKKVGPENSEDYRIFRSRLVGDTWTTPERVSLGGEFSDLYPSISLDGRRMVFSSYRPAPGDTSKKPNAHLWYVDRVGDGWGPPVFMREASLLGWYHSQPTIGRDGSVAVGRTSPDWSRSERVVSRWNGSAFGVPVVDDPAARWKSWRPDLHVWNGVPSPDGSFMILEISRVDTATRRRAPGDLWVSVSRNGTWAEPRRLGPGVNSDQTENFVFFSPDGRVMYFVREFAAFYRVGVDEILRLGR